MKSMLKTYAALLSIALVSVACTESGGDGAGGKGGSCSVLSASSHNKVFNGQTCDENAQTPVVGIFPIARNGDQMQVAGICTGSLVTLDDVVTSAHCFTAPARELGESIVGWVVVAGGEDGEAIPVSNVAIHPRYSGRAGSPYDIAMATLERVPNPAIGPLPVEQAEDTRVGDRATVFGYGTSNKGEIGTLKAADFTIEAVDDGNIFSTLENSGVSICQGDSGGPAIRQVDGVSALIGISSFGTSTDEECAASGAEVFGFVNIQNPTIIDFMRNYAPDIAVR